jgi:hypothetical protein
VGDFGRVACIPCAHGRRAGWPRGKARQGRYDERAWQRLTRGNTPRQTAERCSNLTYLFGKGWEGLPLQQIERSGREFGRSRSSGGRQAGSFSSLRGSIERAVLGRMRASKVSGVLDPNEHTQHTGRRNLESQERQADGRNGRRRENKVPVSTSSTDRRLRRRNETCPGAIDRTGQHGQPTRGTEQRLDGGPGGLAGYGWLVGLGWEGVGKIKGGACAPSRTGHHLKRASSLIDDGGRGRGRGRGRKAEGGRELLNPRYNPPKCPFKNENPVARKVQVYSVPEDAQGRGLPEVPLTLTEAATGYRLPCWALHGRVDRGGGAGSILTCVLVCSTSDASSYLFFLF